MVNNCDNYLRLIRVLVIFVRRIDFTSQELYPMTGPQGIII